MGRKKHYEIIQDKIYWRELDPLSSVNCLLSFHLGILLLIFFQLKEHLAEPKGMVRTYSLIYRMHKPPGLNWTEVYWSNSYIPRWWHLLRVVIKHQLCPTLNQPGIEDSHLLPSSFWLIRLYITGTTACLIQNMRCLFVLSLTVRKSISKFSCYLVLIMTSWFSRGDNILLSPIRIRAL